MKLPLQPSTRLRFCNVSTGFSLSPFDIRLPVVLRHFDPRAAWIAFSNASSLNGLIK